MDRQYVGIDFHRRRSVIVRLDTDGARLGLHRIVNDPFELTKVIACCGEAPQVVIEATYGWYWAVDLLQDLGATVHLANPNALNWGDRRVKNDERDAHDLADMLRVNRLGEAWIAPPALRELRELVRYRSKLVQLRTGLKAQVHGLAGGVPIKVMQERLGHAKIETTLGYTHSLPGMQEQAAEAVERMILGR